MISIGDYRVDNVNWFKEHEGCDVFQCDILYLNKKIGSFSEDYMAGPDNYNFLNGSYNDNLTQLRNTAKTFFDNFSKEVEMFENEDFFIRFLQKLNEAELESALDETILIDTSYPFDYEIVPKTNNDLEPILITGKEKNKLKIPTIDFDINIDLLNMEDTYEL